MRKFVMLLVMVISLGGLTIPSYNAQTDPPDNIGGSDDIDTRCETAHSSCMNNANFVYAVCASGGSVGCYEKALESYNKCMTGKGCTPKSDVCFGSRTGTKACQ